MNIKETIEVLGRMKFALDKCDANKFIAIGEKKCGEAFFHAIEICQAVESAEGELPEKKEGTTVEDMFTAQHSEWKGYRTGFNQAIDIARPILAKAKLRIEELENIIDNCNRTSKAYLERANDYYTKLQSLKEKLTVKNVTNIFQQYLFGENAHRKAQRVAQALIKELED